MRGRARNRPAQGPTLAGAVEAYLADLAMRAKPGTIRSARSALRLASAALPDDLRLVDRPALEAWRRARVASGVANRTVNRDLTTLGACLRFAVEMGTLKANPAAGIRRLPTHGRFRRKVARALDDGEIARLLAGAEKVDAAHPARFPRAPLLRALFATGCRWNELASATWADLDTDRALLRLREEETKTGRARLVPLPGDLLHRLLALRADHVRVTGDLPTARSRIFLSPRGKPWGRDTSNFHRFLAEAMRVARIPKADAAGRVLPRTRHAQDVPDPLRAARRPGPTRGAAHRDRDAASGADALHGA